MSSFFKGAVSSVGGAAASVVGVASNRRGSSIANSNEIVLKDKLSIMVKETTVKDAQSVRNVAIRSGVVMKRNEQGVWQKRFCCLVPHMFLYYFENESSETPRGVIDLEYFTEIDIQNGNVLKISPASHVQAGRGFFFQIDDVTEMSDWMGSLHRDRYSTVRDERDAYQQLQDQFSGQMDMTSKMLEESSNEKEKLSYEVAHVQREIAAAKLALHQVLTRTTVIANALDLSTSDDPDDFDTNKMGQAIKEKLEAIKGAYDDKITALAENTSKEIRGLKDLVLSLQNQLGGETQSRRQAESQALQDKRESDMKIREALGQIEKANHSYQMVWNMKTGLEEKNNKNSEQKKILVKEVKHLRKRLEESDDLNDQISAVNDKLIAVTSDLRQQVENQRKKIETQQAAILASSDTSLHEVIQLATLPENSASPDNESIALANNNNNSSSTTNVSVDVMDVADRVLAEASVLTQKSGAGAGAGAGGHKHHKSHSSVTSTQGSDEGSSHDIDQLLLDDSSSSSIATGVGVGTSMTKAAVEDANRFGRTASTEWDFRSDTSASSILNMEWLSPEQRQLAAQRQQQQQQQGGGDANHNSGSGSGSGSGSSGLPPKQDKRSSISMFTDVLTSAFHINTTSNSEHGVPHSSSPATVAPMMSSSSPALSDGGSGTGATATTATAAATDQPNSFIDASYANNGKPTCFRCGGTVEGPKYSTCKCTIPAMSPLSDEEMEKEDHGIQQAWKGFFKKGTSKAGDLANVARKKSLAVKLDLFNSNKDQAPVSSTSNSNNNTSTPVSASAPAPAPAPAFTISSSSSSPNTPNTSSPSANKTSAESGGTMKHLLDFFDDDSSRSSTAATGASSAASASKSSLLDL